MKITRSISRSTVSITLLLALMLSIAPPAHAADSSNTWARIDTSSASQGVINITVDAVPSGYAVVSLFWKENSRTRRIHRINRPHLCSCTDGGFFFEKHGVLPCRNMLILKIKKIHNTDN